ncbi:MAG: DUF3553 domain-containing protein [Xanthomonadales bacterium]|nr:DUF3553 domain-containing protein [Xanthomonadales bacterium]MCB1643444.1 DUF3553 domain-containing protein [Xanthomonadales bacterium]
MARYARGRRIRHPRCPDWGLGEVLEDSDGKTVRAFFVGAGEKKLALEHVQPTLVDGHEAEHPLLDSLRESPGLPSKNYRSFRQVRDDFLETFPQGFYGEKYLDHERRYKEKACLLATELLNAAECTRLLKAGEHAEICKRALRLMNATNLVYPNEKMALKDGLAQKDSTVSFAGSLADLLHGEGDIEEQFERFVCVLEELEAAKWTTATYFMFFVHPTEHMFVKPTITQNAAEVCGFEISYQPRPNWKTYSAVLKLAKYLRDELAEQKPRDMVDVQSFMWCVAPGNYS